MNSHSMARTIMGAFMMVFPAQSLFPQIVINEIMQNPEFVADNDGEWFELYNTSNASVDINGWTIRDDGSNVHVIDFGQPLIVPSHGYLVLGRDADPSINGNVPVDYAYGTAISLGNGSDQVIIEDQSGNEVDRVEYDDGQTFPDPAGASMELIHPSLDNNKGASWGTAITSWDGHDLGTPSGTNSVLDTIPPALASVSATNPSFVDVRFSEAVSRESGEIETHYEISPGIGNPLFALVDSTDGALVHLTVSPLEEGTVYTLKVSDISDPAGNTMSPDSLEFSVSQPPSAGTIIITEIMNDPTAVNDSDGEWFELFNATDAAIDLEGWEFSDDASNHFTVSGSFIVPPFDFAIMTVNNDSATNGGMQGTRMYDWGSSGTFTLGNTADKIIVRSGGTTIDSVSYDGGTLWPDTSGSSIGLADFGTDNNDGSNWSIARGREPEYFGATGDYGSPGTLGSNQSLGGSGMLIASPDSLTFFCGEESHYSLTFSLLNGSDFSVPWYADAVSGHAGCSWLTVVPDSGTLPPGGSATLTVTGSGAGLSHGVYTCTLGITSEEPSVGGTSVSVTLHVLDTLITGSVTIPDEFLPVPPEGATLPVVLGLRSRVGIPAATEAWITLHHPGSTAEKLVIQPKSPHLTPFDTLTKGGDIVIPSDGPPGTYQLGLHLGIFPDSIQFTSTFEFEKLPGDLPKSGNQSSGVPDHTGLLQNHPNPFNASTRIMYQIPEDTWVTLTVYNLLGQEVITLVDGFETAGYKEITWRGENKRGEMTGSGWYLYRLKAGDFDETRKMLQVK